MQVVVLGWGVIGCGHPHEPQPNSLPVSVPAPFRLTGSSVNRDGQPGEAGPVQPRNPQVRLSFSLPPDPRTALFPAVRLGPRGQTVQYSLTVRLVDRQILLTPRSLLSPNTEHIVELQPGLRALTGQPLDGVVQVRFWTGEQVAAAPEVPPPLSLRQLVGSGGVLAKGCVASGCHRDDPARALRAAAGLDLTWPTERLWQALIAPLPHGLEGLPLVEPGQSAASYLLRKLLAAQPDGFARITGSGMPQNGPPLSLDALRQVEQWIDAGAQP